MTPSINAAGLRSLATIADVLATWSAGTRAYCAEASDIGPILRQITALLEAGADEMQPVAWIWEGPDGQPRTAELHPLHPDGRGWVARREKGM